MSEVDRGRPLLKIEGLVSGYDSVQVLDGVSLQVCEGELVAIVGSNGAGKSTLLKTISGLLPVTQGTIEFEGRVLNGLAPHQIVAAGLLHVAEGRKLFREQSVRANLDLGFYGAGLSRSRERDRIEYVLDIFPVLGEKLDLLSGSLSGGQQQMLAIAQALVRAPRLLLLDEPSLGLAPVIVDQVLEVLKTLHLSGCAIVLVEQLVERALDIADFGYLVTRGRISGSGTARELREGDLVKEAYLGASPHKHP